METKSEKIVKLSGIIDNKAERIKRLKVECGQRAIKICVLNERITKLEAVIQSTYEYLERGGNIECGSIAHGDFEIALKDRPESKESELERLAKKAARTGNRKDLQEYLKARRNAR